MEEGTVAQRARQFEELLRSRVLLSFNSSRRRRSSSGVSGVELTDRQAPDDSAASCSGDASGSGAGHSVGPAVDLTRMGSSRWRGEEALNSLISETSNLLVSAQPNSQVDTVAALAERLADLALAMSSKEDEVQNLQAVMKQLTETRAEAIRLKVDCLESYNRLQGDYSRVLKAAQLAQQASRHNLSKALQVKATLRDTQDQLHREKAVSVTLLGLNQQLEQRNRSLEARLAALEAAVAAQPIVDCRQSVCQHVYKDCSIMRNVGLY